MEGSQKVREGDENGAKKFIKAKKLIPTFFELH